MVCIKFFLMLFNEVDEQRCVVIQKIDFVIIPYNVELNFK